MALREEDEEIKKDSEQMIDGESNFFLEAQPSLDIALKDGEGYDEVETVNKKSSEDDEDDDDAGLDKLEQADPDRAQRLLD